MAAEDLSLTYLRDRGVLETKHCPIRRTNMAARAIPP